MNKFTFMCCLAGSISLPALANTGDKITSLDQLSNSKCYTITPMENARGTWFFKSENPNFLYSTGKTGTAVDANSQNQQFASSNIKYIDNQLVTVIKIQMICKCKYKTI